MLRTTARRNAPDLSAIDRLVLTGDALRAARTTTEVADVVAAAAVEVAGAEGATLHLAHASMPDEPRTVGRAEGDVRVIEVPTMGATSATLVVHGGRTGDPSTDGLLTLLAQQAAAAVDRLSTVVPLERIDPLTGAGNRRQAVADIASLRADDGVVLVALAPGAAFEAVATLATYLRSHTRPPGDSVTRIEDTQFMVVLRGLKAPVGEVAQRLLVGWRDGGFATGITIGCATHRSGSAPVLTRDDAASALATAIALGGDCVLASPT